MKPDSLSRSKTELLFFNRDSLLYERIEMCKRGDRDGKRQLILLSDSKEKILHIEVLYFRRRLISKWVSRLIISLKDVRFVRQFVTLTPLFVSFYGRKFIVCLIFLYSIYLTLYSFIFLVRFISQVCYTISLFLYTQMTRYLSDLFWSPLSVIKYGEWLKFFIIWFLDTCQNRMKET